MFLKFSLTNVQSGKTGIPAYVDAAEIISWSPLEFGDDLTHGLHRTMRGKTVVVINLKSGAMHWSDESFDTVSAKILEARDQKSLAEVHQAAARIESAKNSKLAV